MAATPLKLGHSVLIAGAVVGVLLLIYLLVRGARYANERMKSKFKYFTFSEFDSPDAPGSGQLHMSEVLIRKLDAIRAEVGFPLVVNSGYRTKAHNAAVGGVADSAHTKGLAADVRAFTDAQKTAIAKAAIRQGITRIGWARTYVHLDIDSTKPQKVVWNYGNSSPSFSSLA